MFDGPSNRGFWQIILLLFGSGFVCGGIAGSLLVYFLMS